ncbi:MAG TPA: response regulator, partial [Leptospiraceae bacterium]|nr:response regulator [Leptospiraceae bacterium]
TLIKEIRAADKEVPILTLTTESEEPMKQSGFAAGANGWIVKPFRPAQFLDIVRQILS